MWNPPYSALHPTRFHGGPWPLESVLPAGVKARGRLPLGLGTCEDSTGPCHFETHVDSQTLRHSHPPRQDRLGV